MDFEELAQEIKESGNDIERQQNNIQRYIRAFTNESHYWVACKWKVNMEDMEPFVGYHNEDTPCFYVFTDEQLAYNFANHYGLNDPDGKSYAMKLPITDFMNHIMYYEMNGVELVSFNDGGHYFIYGIDSIIDIIKEK